MTDLFIATPGAPANLSVGAPLVGGMTYRIQSRGPGLLHLAEAMVAPDPAADVSHVFAAREGTEIKADPDMPWWAWSSGGNARIIFTVAE